MKIAIKTIKIEGIYIPHIITHIPEDGAWLDFEIDFDLIKEYEFDKASYLVCKQYFIYLEKNVVYKPTQERYNEIFLLGNDYDIELLLLFYYLTRYLGRELVKVLK
jgi:hypothetical protein